MLGDDEEMLFLIVLFALSLSCVAQWMSYQEARQTVIELMNEAEKKLTEFSTAKAATSQEAEDKLCSHRVRESKLMSCSTQNSANLCESKCGLLIFLSHSCH